MDSYWDEWETTKRDGEDGIILKRSLEKLYNGYYLYMYDAIPELIQGKIKDGGPTAENEWFARNPHPDSGYGAYDGRCGFCSSKNTVCTDLTVENVAVGVKDGHADIICMKSDCGKYTRMEYWKDSS